MMDVLEAVMAALDAAATRRKTPAAPTGAGPEQVVPAPAPPVRYRVVPAGNAGSAPQAPPAQPQPPAPAPRTRGLLSAFRGGDGLIAAVIAAEVLAPPVALREGNDLPGR